MQHLYTSRPDQLKILIFETTGVIGTIWTIIWKLGLRNVIKIRYFETTISVYIGVKKAIKRDTWIAINPNI